MKLNHKFVVKEYPVYDYAGGELFERRVIGIGIEIENIPLIIPSPVTNFIKATYRRKTKSLSSQRNAAYEITKFLNYVIQQIKNEEPGFILLKDKGLFGLELRHGANYIHYLSNRARTDQEDPRKIRSRYVTRIENYLTSFYRWLRDQQITSEPFVDGDNSPFDNPDYDEFIYPGRDEDIPERLVDFGKHRYELAMKFIRIAETVESDIALGICFQFFGGLRHGEVVNLTKKSIDYPNYWSEQDAGNKKFILKIKDNQKELFSHRRNLAHEQVKNPRLQSLLVNDVLSSVYLRHKKRLAIMERRRLIKNKDALFVSSRTGNAISGKRYYEKFSKVKALFLKQLSEEGRISDYEYLTSKDWSTHICRGVFTNFLLDIGSSIPDIAIARGDKSLTAMLKYVEELNAQSLSEEAINRIREAYEKQESKIDETLSKKWRKNNVV